MNTSLTAQHLVKRYGGVTALTDGNLHIQSGEVLALVGANGSGKSTLTKIITGVVSPDAGRLLLDGKEVSFSSPHAARRKGIAAVYQELSLVPDMTIAENIWLTHEPARWNSFVRGKETRARTRALLDLFAGTISPALGPSTPVLDLSPDERQIIEILKALSLQPRIMILDEATANLDSRQVEHLFSLMEQWKEQGMGLVFVSHRMEEIFRVADQMTVLRSGSIVASMPKAETDEQALVNLMVEGAQASRYISHNVQEQAGEVSLRAVDLSTRVVQQVSFELRAGEILGLGGLRGQGQSDILLALFGALPFHGKITLAGQGVHFSHPLQALRAGLAYVPGDRGREGLLSIRSILENLQLPSWKRYGGILRMSQARRDAGSVAQRLGLVMASLDAPVSSLSGGNAQKVVLGKWLLREPKVLLLDDPTKGVDVTAKEEFYKMLAGLRAAGTALLLYSSDDQELLGLCDRVLVLHSGQVQAELAQSTLNHSELIAASMGSTHKGEAV